MVKIGRKSYEIKAVVCDVGQDILGMDFLDKYKLGFEWDDFDQTELFIVDKKAKIKEELQMVTVPANLPRNRGSGEQPQSRQSVVHESGAHTPDQVAALNQAIAFQIACVKKLATPETKKKSVEEQLAMHQPKYAE